MEFNEVFYLEIGRKTFVKNLIFYRMVDGMVQLDEAPLGSTTNLVNKISTICINVAGMS